MSERSSQDALVQQLLHDREVVYLRAVKAEQELKKLSDVEAIKADYEARLAKKDETLQEKDQTIEAKDRRISELEQKLLYLERKMWGSMSEKHRRIPDDPNQLKFDFGELDMTPEEERQAKEAAEEIAKHKTVKVKAHEKRIPVRQKLPENLRRIQEHIYPEGYEGHEDEWILFEETETSEHLEIVPAEMYVRETIRHKGMRKSTGEIITAPIPCEPIAKSYASVSLLTDLMVGKYVDHLPFYRQIQMYKRLGVTLAASTIESWFHETADLMRPSYYRLREIVLSRDYVQSDETTVPVINNEKHRTVKGYLWLVRSVEDNLVFFSYYEGSRAAKVAWQIFKGYKGAIQTDGYPVYELLEKLEGIIILCCWAHCRRYFERSLGYDKARAEYALAQIGLLYDVETMADDMMADAQKRMELRQRLSYPIIRAFEKWCLTEQPKVLPKSPIGKAITYFLNHARQLARYTMDGRYLIDNNLIENSVRGLSTKLCQLLILNCSLTVFQEPGFSWVRMQATRCGRHPFSSTAYPVAEHSWVMQI